MQAGISEGEFLGSKKDLSERDICTKFINPALVHAGWDLLTQVREEVAFTRGRIIVRGKLVTRGKAKRADYILYYQPNLPIALIEAKDNRHAVGDGIQQGLEYAAALDIPFVFSSNGDAQRISQLCWMFFLKIIDDQELEMLNRGYRSPIPEKLRWRAWAADPEGVKTRLKEHLLGECNLHTIVRLPNSVFKPYASIGTNVLFFEKRTPTKESGDVVD